ncbi:hypothetical protein IWW56_001739 [Coemansia sp. RSA 2131]|nr:hypothetical protein IWW56_001739 [Coemansia sp. RSA 2131]
MQSGFCSKSLRPSLAALRRCSSRSAIQHRYVQQRYAHSDKEKYPELEDILGEPAKTFSEVVDQLELLIKHPNPPRNYADALAKEELRRIDRGDLRDNRRKERLAPGMLMHASSKPKEYGLDVAGQNAAHDQAVRTAKARKANISSVSDARSAQDGTLDLESRAEQKHRHRIWKNKVEGYKQFHAELLSMDHLLDTLKEARTESQDYLMDEENEDLEDGEAGSAEDIDVLKIDPRTVPMNDREFQKLLSKSWELFDEDLAPTVDEEEGGAKATTQEQLRMYTRPHSSGPAGTRSFHTTRQILHSP